MEESLENELDSDDGPLNLLVLKTNHNAVENPFTEETLEESSRKAEREVKGKKQKKDKQNEKSKGKTKNKEKSKWRSKEKEIKPSEIEFDWGKNMFYMQKNKVV